MRRPSSPQGGKANGDGTNTPGSIGGNSVFFSDALTVDSWNTTMTAMLQPHKTQKNVFQCPTHLSFTTKNPLDLCPHCERQQQLTLQERRRSVEQQLRDMDVSSTAVTKDILSDLQSTVRQWKQPTTSNQTSTPTTSGDSQKGSNNTTSTQNVENANRNINASNKTPIQNNKNNNTQTSTLNTFQNNMSNQNDNNNHQNNNQNLNHALPYVNGPLPPQSIYPHQQTLQSLSSFPPYMQPQPSIVPGFPNTPMILPGASPATATPSPLDALALQIQGMHRMQDWMIYQKEQECQTLRQRLDLATQQINKLAVENALLQEKLNQQEQRMVHELKLIKLAALQQKRSKSSPSNANDNVNGLVVVASKNPNGSNSVGSHHSDDLGGSATNDSFAMFTNASDSTLPKTSVVTSALTRQDQDVFVSSVPVAPVNNLQVRHVNSAASNSSRSTASHNNTSTNALKLMNSQSSSPESQNGRPAQSMKEEQNSQALVDPPFSSKSGPIDLDEVDDSISPEKGAAPTAFQQARNNPSSVASDDDFSYEHIPRDIQIEPSIANSTADASRTSSAFSLNKPIPALKPPPEKAALKAKPVQQQQQQWSSVVEDMANPPAPILVNNSVCFPDSSDNMSIGNTVASSTYGEDRQQVANQVILDPYGDRGTYTGVILRSTGMPHGSGRMIYQEDKRTYDGEWRHGRWHGYGRATFANGDNYHGEYRFDQRHGRGRYEWNDGRVYDGMFREDKRHGRGIFTWPDGAVYEGDFRNGQREGHGTYRFSDGGRYEGGWKDGRYNGFGICNWEDGRCYKGEWLNGMAHGKGVETLADGTIRHDGQWVEDEPVVA